MKYYYLLFSILLSNLVFSQIDNDLQLTFSEYLGYVKQFHPIVKQANLKLEEGQANLIKARGGFDPKVMVDYSSKDYKNKDYYNLFNAKFKIPTWYGIEAKAGFEENDGVFLNPENNTPTNGLFSAGIKASLGQGLFINNRMATLKKAKYYNAQTKAERDLLINKTIYNASIAYFNWLQAYNETQMYTRFLNNAKKRFTGVKTSVIAGDKAGIDSLEANINVNNRKLILEQSKIKLLKTSLLVSNFLWLDNEVPIDINESVKPEQLTKERVDNVLNLEQSLNFNIEAHPKLKAINSKISSLEVEKSLKSNKLLPKIDLEYNFITQNPDVSNTFNTANYKAGLKFVFPLFLRKERGELKLANLKIEASNFDRKNTTISIANNVKALIRELDSYQNQNTIIANIVKDYTALLKAEERKFSFGESSVFLINYRESSLIDAELKQLKLQNAFYKTQAKLFNSLAIML